MFNAIAKVTKTKDNLGSVAKSLQTLAQKEVYVGIPEGQRGEHDGISNAQLMYVLTHGVRKKSMRDEMNDFMGLTASGMPITRSWETFSENMDKMPYSTAYDLYIHEHGSPVWQIPPRPILEPAINNSKDEIAKELGKAITVALDGEDPSAQLGDAGMHGVKVANDWFTNPENHWPPNSPVTIKGTKPDENGDKFIKGKGSNRPNIDTGSLRRSITYVVASKS